MSYWTLWNRSAGFKVQIANMKCCWLHWSKFVIHIEYAEYKYRNLPVLVHIKHKTTVYMQAFALVAYTWVKNVAIYLFDNRIWQISSCCSVKNLNLCFVILIKIANIWTMHSNCIRTRNDSVHLTFCRTNMPKHSWNGSYTLLTSSWNSY